MDVEYRDFGRITVQGTVYDHDVVIDGGTVGKRDKRPSRSARALYGHTPLTGDEALPLDGTRLIIGTGDSGRLPVTDTVLAAARAADVEVVTMPTADAAALIRSMDAPSVYAILHVTC
jgi:hypothetical protein